MAIVNDVEWCFRSSAAIARVSRTRDALPGPKSPGAIALNLAARPSTAQHWTVSAAHAVQESETSQGYGGHAGKTLTVQFKSRGGTLVNRSTVTTDSAGRFQPAQAVASARHPLRQARHHLPRRARHRRTPALATQLRDAP